MTERLSYQRFTEGRTTVRGILIAYWIVDILIMLRLAVGEMEAENWCISVAQRGCGLDVCRSGRLQHSDFLHLACRDMARRTEDDRHSPTKCCQCAAANGFKIVVGIVVAGLLLISRETMVDAITNIKRLRCCCNPAVRSHHFDADSALNEYKVMASSSGIICACLPCDWLDLFGLPTAAG